MPSLPTPNPGKPSVRIRVLGNRLDRLWLGDDHSQYARGIADPDLRPYFQAGRAQTGRPAEFPRRIMIDLFDGKLHGNEAGQGPLYRIRRRWAVDYDFDRDVGLIRIKPGRRLPACRVVPAHWQPQPRMQVLTVGCSEGQDATAWHTTITKPRIQNSAGQPDLRSDRMRRAPKQGRSGGGLFTDDGYIAGVCNFAEPQGDHGLYATPRSIYKLLDRNDLMALYAPVSRGNGTLVADRGGSGKSRRNAAIAVARAQSPDQDESERGKGGAGGDELVVPHPSRLGIPQPIDARAENSPRPASDTTRRIAWQPRPIQLAEPTDLNLDPAADHDGFGAFAGDEKAKRPASTRNNPPSRSIVGASTGSRWHRVQTNPVSDDNVTTEK